MKVSWILKCLHSKRVFALIFIALFGLSRIYSVIAFQLMASPNVVVNSLSSFSWTLIWLGNYTCRFKFAVVVCGFSASFHQSESPRCCALRRQMAFYSIAKWWSFFSREYLAQFAHDFSGYLSIMSRITIRIFEKLVVNSNTKKLSEETQKIYHIDFPIIGGWLYSRSCSLTYINSHQHRA